MALNAFTAGLTAAQIVTQVEAMAGHPNLHLDASGTEAITNLAYRWLNELIVELNSAYEWPFNETGADITITARENNLPTDFYRLRFQEPLLIKAGDSRIPVLAVSADAFYHAIAGEPTYGEPRIFTIDQYRATLFVNPIPSAAVQCELHYQRYIPRLSATSAVPSFPNSDLLIQKLLAKYAQHQKDWPTYQAAKAEAAEMLQRMRASVYGDGDSAMSQVPLDRGYFRAVVYD